MRAVFALSLLLVTGLAAAGGDHHQPPEIIRLPGLQAPGKILRDVDGIPHVIAHDEHDMTLLQGWVHAQDRLFQIDVLRRTASGTLAELVGLAVLGDDIELRTIGLRRAAERSYDALSDEMRMGLDAFAEGVNAYVEMNGLPVEYGILELTEFEPWTAVDSVVIAKLLAFSLSFDLDITPTIDFLTYQGVGAVAGFDGEALYFEDLFRSAPFAPIATVPQATGTVPFIPLPSSATTTATSSAARASVIGARNAAVSAPGQSEITLRLARGYLERVRHIDVLRNALDSRERIAGSNEFAASRYVTRSGRPIIANDPHLSLGTPATFYQNHIRTRHGGFNVVGSSVPGGPYVILGQNRFITWGATNNRTDVTDTFQEQLVVDPNSPSGLATVYLGNPEPVIPIPELYFYNQLDGQPDNLALAPPNGTIGGVFVPAATLIVPRRNHGPIVNLDMASMTALSVQYTGFSGTRELDAFRIFNLGQGLADFQYGLQFFDFGSQNFVYSDIAGNIGYFTSAEIPVREDTQANTITGSPPWFIRNGTGGNEWLPVINPQPGQAVPFEVLRQDELPQFVNPDLGWYVNANNDPSGATLDNDPLNQLRTDGTGLYYLDYSYAIGNRTARITARIEEGLAKRPLTLKQMQSIQADVGLFDAEFFTPFILSAFDNAQDDDAAALLQSLANDPRVAEAIGRLAEWDYTTPTGVFEGYDATDTDGIREEPSDNEVATSIAATVYSVWRGQFVGNTIDTTLGLVGLSDNRPGSGDSMKALKNLLENFETNEGFGASGLNFFNVPGVDGADDRRDILLLLSLQNALDLLAGPAFEPAFGLSSDQSTYVWGRLHRIVFDAVLGVPFSIPPAGGAFPPSFEDLPGIATDGGFDVVDASSHSARADNASEFMFGAGPVRRYVGRPGHHPGSIRGKTILPGGESGVLGNEFYVNLLGRWLTNDTYTIRQSTRDVVQDLDSVTLFKPVRPGQN